MKKITYMSVRSNQLDYLPNLPGVYAAFLRFPDPSDFGLFKDLEISKESVDKAIRNYKIKLKNYLRLLDHKLVINISDEKKQGFLTSKYSGIVARDTTNIDFSFLDNVSNDAFVNMLSVVSTLNVFTTPVYIGITTEQTIRERVKQHHRDFINDSENNKFGTRLNNLSLEWEDLNFLVYGDLSYSENENSLKAIENILHVFCSPYLSER